MELKEMAKGDNRIEFLGFINDDDVIEYYSNSLCVLYMPYEEDYGLVTIEAMMSGKLVITCNDSGGTNEFVKHGMNGYICNPNAMDIAKYINKICSLNKSDLTKMGQNAYDSVKSITWESVVNGLTNSVKHNDSIISTTKKRKKLQ